MERRLFVKLSAFIALALTLPLTEGCSEPKEIAVARPFFFSLLADDKGIRQAGLAYRKTHIAEDNKESLSKLLFSRKVASPDIAGIQVMLDEQVTTDFKKGDILLIDGWVMSLTEARQCALYSILKS